MLQGHKKKKKKRNVLTLKIAYKEHSGFLEKHMLFQSVKRRKPAGKTLRLALSEHYVLGVLNILLLYLIQRIKYSNIREISIM